MPLPQRVNVVTLGAWSVRTLRAFYGGWGWSENEGATDEYVSFRVGSVVLAVFPIERLAIEAARDARLPGRDDWTGVTLAINLSSRAEVDRAMTDTVAAGGVVVAEAVDREWGGYSGYIADPEGHRWELAWAPDFNPE